MADVLPYAPPVKRRSGRFVVVVTAAVFSVILTSKFGVIAWHRARVLYWQHQCMVFSAPADAVVWERRKLSDAAPAPVRGFVDSPTIPPPGIAPTRMSIQGAANTAYTFRMPKCWLNLCIDEPFNQWGYFRAFPDAVAFVHPLRSRSGLERLVAVNIPFDLNGCALTLGMSYFAVVPGTLAREPTNQTPPMSWVYSGPFMDPPRRFFAGQIDPADASHFTIGYQWDDGFTGTIDGWLQDDGKVRLTVRPGTGDCKSEMNRRFKHG